MKISRAWRDEWDARWLMLVLVAATGCQNITHDMQKQTDQVGRLEYLVPCPQENGSMRRVRVYAKEGDTLTICDLRWGVIDRDLLWLNSMSGDVLGVTRIRPVGASDPYGLEAMLREAKAKRRGAK